MYLGREISRVKSLNNAQMRAILLILCFYSCCIGCVSCSSTASAINWKEVPIEQFRHEVETSGHHDVWNYAGSDDSYHYFFRFKALISLFGSDLYRKVARADVPGLISSAEEMRFNGKAWSLSFAFTKAKEHQSGYTNVLSRGLVDSLRDSTP